MLNLRILKRAFVSLGSSLSGWLGKMTKSLSAEEIANKQKKWRYVTDLRLGGALIFATYAIITFLLTRIVLCFMSWKEVDASVLVLAKTFLCGLPKDLAVVAYFCLPLTLWLAVLSQRRFISIWHRRLIKTTFFLAILLLLFNQLAEFVFWSEFSTRFNFIAVDYLVYTTEVLSNIWQSYPVCWLIGGIIAIALLIYRGVMRLALFENWFRESRRRPACFAWVSSHIVVVLLLTLFFKNDSFLPFSNPINAELAGNGLHSLFAAYRSNTIDYETFYPQRPLLEIGASLRQQLQEDNATFISAEPLDIRRNIINPGSEKRWNVVVVVEESLSASFTGCLADKSYTPYLDKLAKKGLLFTRCFASGTRTVRGLEAVTLSLPPTPGQSIVRRPDNKNLYSLSTLFRERGYACTFLYGGYGRFDNMNAFFSANGYAILDRSRPEATPQNFANAWGVCDENLFQWSLDAADRSLAAGQPFHQFIMTTSNHRPYTFPEGAVDYPQKNRSSAVLYSDYALGKYIAAAANKPWFGNTLFVIVADHCHSTSGRQKLPLEKYHIPLVFYAPGLITPQRIETVCSQIDIGPTIFGLMNWSYCSQFYGLDLNRLPPERGRALPGTFQRLGMLLANGVLTIMEPGKKGFSEQWDISALPFTQTEANNKAKYLDSIAIFQSASMRHRLGLDRETEEHQPQNNARREKALKNLETKAENK